jgi:nitroimidazol reductase NimA-like FMN-containing flavoprotein (pyridoxamine 5'-phosphate oxidase superfamily)
MIGELKASEIEQLLRSETVGRLGCSTDGRVYIVPVTYVFEEGCVYGHSGNGRKIRMMRENPHVCFEIDRVISQSNWQSVIAWGLYEELQGHEALAGLERLLVRLGPVVVGSAGLPTEGLSAPLVNLAHHILQHGVVYRIRLTERTGRFERVI